MGIEVFPAGVRQRYQIDERGHACAILANDYPSEFRDIMDCLEGFVLRRSHILTPGKGKSPISKTLDDFLHGRGWHEKSFDIKITIDGSPVPIPTHKIDNFKNEVGLEVEWNNKTEFYDRDLNNFRLLKELRVLAAARDHLTSYLIIAGARKFDQTQVPEHLELLTYLRAHVLVSRMQSLQLRLGLVEFSQ